MPRSQLAEHLGRQFAPRCRGNPARRHRPEGCGSPATLEQRTLAEHGPRSDLSHRTAVDLDREYAVEEQVHVLALVALDDQRRARLDRLDAWFDAATHDPERELALERGFDLGHQRRRILVTPGRVPAKGVLVPALEIHQSRLLSEIAVTVVDPMARERTGAGELMR